jgi:branched-chain amino acid transport system substrate-binding protein
MMSEKQKPFMVYSIISGVTMAMRPETEANKMILMGAVGTDKFIVNANYTIRNYVSATTIGNHIAPFIKDSLKVKTVSIFYANNEYSTSVKNGVEQKCKEAGLTIQFTQPFDEKVPDYKSLVAASINNKTECIFIDGIGNGMGSMIKQIRESGYKGLIVSDPIIKFPDVMTAAGDAIKGVYYMDYSFDENSQDPNTKSFVDDFKAKYNSSPANFAVIGYVGMKMFLEKINEIKTLDNDKIIEAINSVTDFTGVFGKVGVKNRELQFTYTYKRF